MGMCGMTGRASSPVEYGGCYDEDDEENFLMFSKTHGWKHLDSNLPRDFEIADLTATVDWKVDYR
jgi:hypothetical protein